MQSSEEIFEHFWMRAFGLTLAEIRSPEPAFTQAGRYLERHGDKYVYFYEDLTTGKKIIAASLKNMESIRKVILPDLLANLDAQTVQNWKFAAPLHLEFCDIDYRLTKELPQIKLNPNFRIRKLTGEDLVDVEDFQAELSDDDRDTLDFRLEDDFGLGVFQASVLRGIARSAAIPDSTGLIDLTVVVSDKARGMSCGKALIAQLLVSSQSRGLVPKYRVRTSNHASIAIAEKLGLTASYHLVTWSTDA